jgi:hypothetical protein
MASQFGVYKNVTIYPLCVKLPAKDVASLPPGKTAVFADAWPGVKDQAEKGKLVRVADAPSQNVVSVVANG